MPAGGRNLRADSTAIRCESATIFKTSAAPPSRANTLQTAFAGFWLRMPSLSPAASVEHTRVRRARPLLGTLVEIEVAAERSNNDLHAAIDAAFAIIQQVHDLMSYQD